jgi:multiple sugar transport system substrate-binding protein
VIAARATTRRSSLRRGALAGGALTLAAGCAPGRSAGPEAAAATVGPAAIRFTYWGAEPEEVSIQDRVIAAFRERHPQVRVENAGDSAGTGPYHEKLVAQAAAGTWSDVGRIQSVDMPRFAKGGLLLALDELVRRERYALDDFWPAVLPTTQYQQRRYTLPVIGGPNPLFWSPKLFREAGVPAATEQDARGAWTWDTFLEAARRLTKEDGGALRVGGYGVDLTWGGLGPFIWSAGGDYYTPQLTRCAVAEPAAVEGVQFMVDLIRRHRVWPAPAEGAGALQWFPGATIAMQISPITGSWQWRRDPAFEFDVVMNPRGRAGQVGRLNANGYAVFSGSRAQAAAWEFLKHLAGAETLALLASLGRSFPWRRSVAQSKEYREGQPIKSVEVVLKLAEQGRTWPVVAAWSDTERFANPVLREMGDGQVSVRDGLERIRAEADRLLTA